MVLRLCREMEPITRAGERAVAGVEYKKERKSSVTNMVDDVGREDRQAEPHSYNLEPGFNSDWTTKRIHQARIEGWPRGNKFLETANTDAGTDLTGGRPK